VPPEGQLLDEVTGVWVSRKQGDSWTEAERVWLQKPGRPTLDDAGSLYFVHHFYEDGVKIEADIYVARRK
jgi:hypothetical protein